MIPASIWKQAEQNPQPKKENFSRLVNELMKAKKWQASDLVCKSRLSKSTVSHILNNTASRKKDGKTVPYRATDRVVTAIAIAFELDKAGWERLMDAAFPERRVWFKALEDHLDIYDANALLDENGLPLLGDA